MDEITEVRRARDLRTLAAVAWSTVTGRKVFAPGDTVQLGNRLYRVTFSGLFTPRVILRDVATGQRLPTRHDALGNVRLVKKGSRRGWAPMKTEQQNPLPFAWLRREPGL